MPFTKLARSWAERTVRPAVVAGLVAATVGLAGQASAQVTNGTFAADGTSTYSLSAGTSSVPSWTVIKTGADGACSIGNTTASSLSSCLGGSAPGTDPMNSGNTAIPFLAAMVEVGGTFGISQGVTLKAGATYSLTFLEAAAETYNDSGQDITWTVSIGGLNSSSGTGCSTGSCVTTINVPQNTVTGWTTVTDSFTATSGSETLQFMAGGTSGPPIALLDSIALSCTANCSSVPEPASLALLGLGLAGLVGVRRRRAAGVAA